MIASDAGGVTSIGLRLAGSATFVASGADDAGLSGDVAGATAGVLCGGEPAGFESRQPIVASTRMIRSRKFEVFTIEKAIKQS